MLWQGVTGEDPVGLPMRAKKISLKPFVCLPHLKGLYLSYFSPVKGLINDLFSFEKKLPVISSIKIKCYLDT
jgi:hypothetical protein